MDVKAECRRIDAFELWCWRGLLRVPWTARRSNQSILKEISPEYSLEGLLLKLQYFGHLTQRTDSLEKTLMLVKNPPAMQGDLGSAPGLGRSPGERKGYPLQYSGLENSMDCMVHGPQRVGHN